MEITNAKYVKNEITNEINGISATIDGVENNIIPLIAGNRHYDYIIANNIEVSEAE